MSVNSERAVPNSVHRVPDLGLKIEFPYSIEIPVFRTESTNEDQALGLSIPSKGQRVPGERWWLLLERILLDEAPSLILQAELPKIAKGVVRQSLNALFLHRQSTVYVYLLSAVNDLSGVKVSALWHRRFGRGFYGHGHPRVVLRVEEPDVVQRSVTQRITAEHPQTASTIGDETVTETRQCFSQMIKMIGEILGIEQFGEHQLMILYLYRTVATSETICAYTVSVSLVTYTLFLDGRAVTRTELYVTVYTDETGLAQAIAAATLPIFRTVAAGHDDVAGVETLDLVELLVVDGQETGFRLDGDRIVCALGTVDTEKLTLMTRRRGHELWQSVVYVDTVLLAAHIYVVVDRELYHALYARRHGVG